MVTDKEGPERVTEEIIVNETPTEDYRVDKAVINN